MGLWSFNGPMQSPVGDYTSLPRRLLRLAHIALISLGIINILYGYEIDRIKIKDKLRNVGSKCIIYGTIFMPLVLISAVFFEPLKYLAMIPAVLIMISLIIIIMGKIKKE